MLPGKLGERASYETNGISVKQVVSARLTTCCETIAFGGVSLFNPALQAQDNTATNNRKNHTAIIQVLPKHNKSLTNDQKNIPTFNHCNLLHLRLRP